MSTWTRVRGNQGTGTSGNHDLVTIAAGHSLLRVHCGITLRARVPALADPNAMAQYVIAAGIYTRLSSGGTIIHPITNPSDTARPTQRWLYWRPMSLLPAAHGSGGLDSYWTWVSEQQPGEIDIKSQVLATPGSIVLAVSWENANTQPAGATVTISWWASILTS